MEDYRNMESILSRFKIKWLVYLLIIGVLIFGVINYIGSFKNIKITVKDSPSNIKINIFEAGSSNKLIKENVAIDTDIRLKKNIYRINFVGEGFKDQNIEVELFETNKVIDITPSFTDDKLSEILNAERNNIISEINQKVPLTQSNFIVTDLKLYYLGEWASAKIHIPQTPEEERENYIDVYRAVLKKDKDTWKLLTDPPELIISIIKYPSIPRDLLIELNKNPESGIN